MFKDGNGSSGLSKKEFNQFLEQRGPVSPRLGGASGRLGRGGHLALHTPPGLVLEQGSTQGPQSGDRNK